MKLFNRGNKPAPNQKSEFISPPSLVQFERKLTAEQQAVQDDIVRTLEKYLERAKNGEYTGIVFAGSRADGNTDTCSSRTNHYPALIGAAHYAVFRLCQIGETADDHGNNKE